MEKVQVLRRADVWLPGAPEATNALARPGLAILHPKLHPCHVNSSQSKTQASARSLVPRRPCLWQHRALDHSRFLYYLS